MSKGDRDVLFLLYYAVCRIVICQMNHGFRRYDRAFSVHWEYAVYKSMQTGGATLVRKAVTIPVKKAASSARKTNRSRSHTGSNRQALEKSRKIRGYRTISSNRYRSKKLAKKRMRAARHGREIKDSRVYQKSYQEGFNQGYAKGYEDGHQLTYANQV